MLANVAYFAVLTPTELLSSNAVAVVGGLFYFHCHHRLSSLKTFIGCVLNASWSHFLLQTFANKLFGSSFRWLMPFFVACSTFGAVNGGIFASSRYTRRFADSMHYAFVKESIETTL